ncbi:SLCO4A1 [Cordylochernes scorpioides]|uniref:SLCO4A1 n=1 Tax=Cordylochernes scorpioides TaxID=51811 RepID=A0ABY6L513_9ARAC|nr:SLCO4A1 [Cordylochernes scorpioides]
MPTSPTQQYLYISTMPLEVRAVLTELLRAGIYYTMAIIGPALGYLTGGQFLQMYTDVGVDAHSLGLTPASSVWVGAWWISFVLSTFIGVLVALPILSFPKTLPGFSKIQAEKVSEMHKKLQNSEAVQSGFGVKLRDLPRSLRFLMTNPTFVFLSLAGATEGMLVSGLATFLPKVIESQFSMASSTAALLVGMVTIPGAGGGTFLGGYVVKKLRLRCANIIRLCVVSTLLCVGLTFVFIARCPQPAFHGLHPAHHPRDNMSLFSCDSVDCHCSEMDYNPICGTDSVTYYSPCFAGCKQVYNHEGSKVYGECDCIMGPGQNVTLDSGQQVTVDATREKCPSSCTILPVFLAVIFLSMFFTFLVSMPSLTATLRYVHNSLTGNDQTIHTNVRRENCYKQPTYKGSTTWQPVIQRIFILVNVSTMSLQPSNRPTKTPQHGTIPAPLLFGVMIDRSCILWQDTCSGSGSCLAFDNYKMSTNVLTIVTVVKFLSFFFFLGAWLCYHPPKDDIQPVPNGAQKPVANGVT